MNKDLQARITKATKVLYVRYVTIVRVLQSPHEERAMAQPFTRPRIVRFGVFELDLAKAELRKHGMRVRLQEQPFHVLSALLEQPGAIVSREELVRRLWQDGTHVHFDRSLNAAVT